MRGDGLGNPVRKIAGRVAFALFTCLALSLAASAQVKISGIVIDSMSFKAVPDVHIRINDKALTTTDDRGGFSIVAAPFDTIVFSRIGYLPVRFPVILDEEDIIVVMSEDVTYLQPVIVTAPFIRSPLIRDKPVVAPRTLRPSKLVTGSGIAFDYFSRAQRERRKLQRLIEANERVHAYSILITDPEFKAEIVKRYALTDDQYYDAVLNFNSNYLSRIEYKTVEEVTAILHDYFCGLSTRCPD